MIEEAVGHLVRGIVDNPDDVIVASHAGRRGQTIEVQVNPDDMGRVIGRAGRTAKAVRTVVGALPGGRGVRIDFIGSDEA